VDPADVSALVDGSLSVMRLLKMLPGTPAMVDHPVWIESVKTIASDQTGIFHPLVARGTYVARGMKVGYVTDYLGRKTFEARAPEAGVVLYICSVPSMKKGETIASIGVVSTSPPP
jgi:predicted deacylase